MGGQGSETARTSELRALLRQHLDDIGKILARYGASNLRLFGSVARGDATEDSDIDLYVDLDTIGADALWALSGLSEELRQLLGIRVDVVAENVLRDQVAESAKRDLTALQ